MVIEYDTTTQAKVTKSYLDPDTLVTFSVEDGDSDYNSLKNLRDMPIYHRDIHFVPNWGAFVYVVKKYLIMKLDYSFDLSESPANIAMTQDPCLRG